MCSNPTWKSVELHTPISGLDLAPSVNLVIHGFQTINKKEVYSCSFTIFSYMFLLICTHVLLHWIAIAEQRAGSECFTVSSNLSIVLVFLNKAEARDPLRGLKQGLDKWNFSRQIMHLSWHSTMLYMAEIRFSVLLPNLNQFSLQDNKQLIWGFFPLKLEALKVNL